MKKSLITISIIFVFLSSIIGQVNFTQNLFEIENSYDPQIINYFEKNNGDFFILKREPIKGPGGWRYFIELRDKNLEKIEVKEISSKLDADNYYIQDYILLKDNLMILSSKLEKDESKEIFYFQNINLNTLKVSERNFLYEITYQKRRKRPSFNFNVSDNKTYFLVEIHPPYKRKEKESVSLHLMDQNMTTIWKREDFGFNVEDRDYGIKKIFISDNSNVYMLGQHTNEMKENIYELFKLSKDKVKTTKVKFDVEDIQKIGLGVNSKNQLIFSGYFSNKETRGIKGVFYDIYDAETLQPIKNITSDFEDEMLLLGASDKTANKQTKKSKKKGFELGASYLGVDYIVTDKNDNLIIIGQEYNVVTSFYTDANGNSHTKTTYYYGSIYLSKFNNENKLVYNSKIPFSQISSKFIPNTYAWLLKDNKISLVFNDNKVNHFEGYIKEKGIKRTGKYKDNVLTSVTISNNGEAKRKILYDYVKKGEKNFRIYDYNMDINSVLMLVYKGKKVFNLALIN